MPLLPCVTSLTERPQVWSPLGANMLWTLFQPWHVFDVAVLAEVAPASSDAREHAPVEIAADVAARIAAELGQVSTAWTTADKAQRSAIAKAMGKARWLEQMRAGSKCT